MIPDLRCLMMYSAARIDSAIMVSVGFFSLDVVKQLPSVTKRFFTSCDWQKLFKAEVLGSFPMRMVPTSWLASPEAPVSSKKTSPESLETICSRPFLIPIPVIHFQFVENDTLEMDHWNGDAMCI